MIDIVLNGEPRQIPQATTVAALLGSLGLDRPGVAVAVDSAVIPRGEHASTELPPGARVEVIRAVGGG